MVAHCVHLCLKFGSNCGAKRLGTAVATQNQANEWPKKPEYSLLTQFSIYLVNRNYRGLAMRNMIVLLVLVIVAVVALGLYLGWFQVSTESHGDKRNINITVDQEKIKQDKEKAKE